MNNFTFGDDAYQYYETICSGAPAGPGFDGASAVHVHMTNSRLTDPEVLESRFPVVLEDFHIRRDSGGKGQWRAGDGTLRRIRFLRPMQAAILSVKLRHLEDWNECRRQVLCRSSVAGVRPGFGLVLLCPGLVEAANPSYETGAYGAGYRFIVPSPIH